MLPPSKTHAASDDRRCERTRESAKQTKPNVVPLFRAPVVAKGDAIDDDSGPTAA
ncbi:hypothetical protein [Bradyrhizobium cenepequi]|uniref:hypothetical protein n=1 Tax=Bradyrhizobium cenepequi TaxID=2821403 RepID=UPI001CE373FE|nr:hypothetical protein [Bradyrhizobium cenepequi]MCA6110749.1 hypothetical protein [Bradyrhizobium cenepequi]